MQIHTIFYKLESLFRFCNTLYMKNCPNYIILQNNFLVQECNLILCYYYLIYRTKMQRMILNDFIVYRFLFV